MRYFSINQYIIKKKIRIKAAVIKSLIYVKYDKVKRDKYCGKTLRFYRFEKKNLNYLAE